jgi:hypothetical protein
MTGITLSSPDWVPLGTIYRHVISFTLTPEGAKIAISAARRNGDLQLRAVVREHKGQPSQPEQQLEEPLTCSITRTADNFLTWDWERGCATCRDQKTKSLFEFIDIIGRRDDVLHVWPNQAPVSIPADRPKDITPRVWAVMQVLDAMNAANLSLPKKILLEKVRARMPDEVSVGPTTLRDAERERRNLVHPT